MQSKQSSFLSLSHGIDFHCHGVGPFDFTAIESIDLDTIEAMLAHRKEHAVLTMYLPKPNFKHFLDLMDTFAIGKELGKYSHIVGIGLEGPLLASHGGTPEKGVWSPSMHHWQMLAQCGKKGLVYIILSPDADLPSSNFENDAQLPPLPWIIETLLTGGVLPAPGHFTKLYPNKSAQRLKTVFELVRQWGHCPTITDHLYNDMPHNFKHAWRTEKEKQHRQEELKELNLMGWHENNLIDRLGPVPAMMIEYAKKDVVKICQNFDGEHVDLAIIKKTVELVGSNNLLLMTDSIESKQLAGRQLHMEKCSTLLYQDDGIVAAGSQPLQQQKENMLKIGLSETDIMNILCHNPAQVLKLRENYINRVPNVEMASV